MAARVVAATLAELGREGDQPRAELEAALADRSGAAALALRDKLTQLPILSGTPPSETPSSPSSIKQDPLKEASSSSEKVNVSDPTYVQPKESSEGESVRAKLDIDPVIRNGRDVSDILISDRDDGVGLHANATIGKHGIRLHTAVKVSRTSAVDTSVTWGAIEKSQALQRIQ